jgi:circadian clock protein KaiC
MSTATFRRVGVDLQSEAEANDTAGDKRMERVRTGIEGLDQLLCGGFLQGDAILVAGSPGSGKTSLGMQFLYHGITKYQEPGLFITFEEFPQRIYRDAQSFGWNFRELEEQGKLKVLFTSPEVLQQDIIRDQSLVNEMIAEIGARRVVVDSITLLHEARNDQHRFRESVYGLANALKRESLTAMLLRELREQEAVGTGPEEFVADALIVLSRSYVGNSRMRFIEVMKSRGSPHIPIPSLFLFTESGIKVLPPFQKPFYRFEEAVSTGIPQLDDLLGGGLPYGAFYLMEIDSTLHQDILDAAFAKEALEAGDIYVRVAGQSDERSRWRALMKAAHLEQAFLRGLESRQARLVWTQAAGAQADSLTPDTLRSELEGLAASAPGRPMRVEVDLSRLFSLLPEPAGYQAFLNLAARSRDTKSVLLGLVNPRAVAPDALEKLRTAADGIVRIWTEGSYSYLQVLKTINSARTPVYAINQVPESPFLEIMAQ